MRWLRESLTLAGKDLRIELRSKETFLSTTLFAVLVAVLSSLAFYLNRQIAAQLAPGVLWIATVFAGLLAISRSWARERHSRVIDALWLAVAHPSAIYCGKVVSTWVLLLAVELVLVPWVAVLFNLDLAERAGALLALLLSGTLGYVAICNLFAALTVKGKARDLLLSVVVFPLVAPALLGAVVASRGLFQGAPWADTLRWLRLITAFDLIALAAGMALFPVLYRD
ncbi:MAG: heme exporter protein CcmB [Polyangiales bacterium]